MIIYVYVLQSYKDCNFYIGITENLEDRVKRHNSGRVQSTRGRAPFKVVFSEEYPDYEEARKREKFFKSGQGRLFLRKFLKL